MSLVKALCILLVTTGIHISLTPPSKLSEKERAPHSGVWAKILEFGIHILWWRKCVYWTVGIAEIVAIIANKSSSSESGGSIIPVIMVGGNANNLRLTPLGVFGFIFISLGALLRLWCFRVMKDLFTFEITIRENHRLVKTGPYSMVRHPSYTAVLALEIGIFCWYLALGSWMRESGILRTLVAKACFGSFALMTMGIRMALVKRAAVEDNLLKKKFGQEWEEWAREVPYAIVPGVY